jgi:hypothetical protein
MAEFADRIIKLKTYALMAYGDAPYEPGNGDTLLVVDKAAGRDKYHPDEINANGFDIGSLRRDFFETKDAAQAHLGDILSGRYALNEFRKIDPESIMLKELMFEVRAIEFDDYEHEIMGVMGALDHMKPGEKAFFKKVFPRLIDTNIAPPDLPDFDTHDGSPSTIVTGTYVLAGAPLREQFNRYADDQAQSITLSAIEVANTLRQSRLLYHTLAGVAEEIGKSRIGLLKEEYSHILHMRLYDRHTTCRPEPEAERSREPTDHEKAMMILSQQDPVVIETILQAMKLRNIRPFPEGFGQKATPGLPTPDLVCK